jgi:acetoin utilization deacetylase AcuC-like enzyme
MESFRPELIIISAGFDAHQDDPLGHLNLTDEDFGELTRLVTALAEKYTGGKILSCLEGGYNIEALSRSVCIHLQNLYT